MKDATTPVSDCSLSICVQHSSAWCESVAKPSAHLFRWNFLLNPSAFQKIRVCHKRRKIDSLQFSAPLFQDEHNLSRSISNCLQLLASKYSSVWKHLHLAKTALKVNQGVRKWYIWTLAFEVSQTVLACSCWPVFFSLLLLLPIYFTFQFPTSRNIVGAVHSNAIY